VNLAKQHLNTDNYEYMTEHSAFETGIREIQFNNFTDGRQNHVTYKVLRKMRQRKLHK